MRADLAVQSRVPVDSRSSLQSADARLGFEELTLPYLNALFNFARWTTRDPHEAEDLVQETYLKALRAFPSLRTHANVRAWLFKILTNTHLNTRTRAERRMVTAIGEGEDLAEYAVSLETPESIFAAGLDRAVLQEAIEKLPQAFKEVLLLCDVEEMSYREIADVLGIPIGTVMSRLSRARRLLRSWLTVQKSRQSGHSDSDVGSGQRMERRRESADPQAGSKQNCVSVRARAAGAPHLMRRAWAS